MQKLRKRIGICFLLAAIVWSLGILHDRKMLNDNLIRLHVVANSDMLQDQNIKLQVKDAVVESLKEDLAGISDISEARQYLSENLPRIQQTVNTVLEKSGIENRSTVTLCRERFDTRYYDTFALPAGVYESLRIVIGNGDGHNWWCVAFPSLCLPSSRTEFEDAAVEAGFSETLSSTLAEDGDFEVRFFLLDQIGRLENIFCGG